MSGHPRIVLAAAVLLTACTTTPTPSTSAPSAPAATVPGATVPGASSTPGEGCAVPEQTGILRSNTLLTLSISSDGLSDAVAFRLGEIAPGPTGSSGRLQAVRPPFVQGGSGLPVGILGEHFVEIHFEGMLLADETGKPTYLGQSSARPDMLAVEQVEMTEAFEGVYNFVIGYRGPGCVALAEDAAAKTLTVTIGH